MRKISDIVRDLIIQDETALTAYQQGYLNFSAYAQLLQPKIEELAWKPVRVNSIVVALSRLQDTLMAQPPTKVPLLLDNLTVKFPLCAVSYDRSPEVEKHLRKLVQTAHTKPDEFFTMTQGEREITFIAPLYFKKKVVESIPTHPKNVAEDVVAVSVSFSPEYLPVPNVVYTILSQLALYHINLVEIVSTHTELSMIITQADLEQAVSALKTFFS
jgi:hypothetical protein